MTSYPEIKPRPDDSEIIARFEAVLNKPGPLFRIIIATPPAPPAPLPPTNIVLPEIRIFAGLVTGAGWGDAVEDPDNKYVHMTHDQFETEKKKAKHDRRFPSWDAWLDWAKRIEHKRRNIIPTSEPKTTSMLSTLLALREDYLRHPERHFRTREERDKELYKLENDIRHEPGGAYKLSLYIKEEVKAAEPEINAIVARVKRGVQAISNVKRLLAGKIIANFLDTFHQDMDPDYSDFEEQNSMPLDCLRCKTPGRWDTACGFMRCSACGYTIEACSDSEDDEFFGREDHTDNLDYDY